MYENLSAYVHIEHIIDFLSMWNHGNGSALTRGVGVVEGHGVNTM